MRLEWQSANVLIALQTALHHLHMPDAGRRCRREARRWVQAQLETKVITGYIAIELGRFLHDRTTARKKHSIIEREDLSTGAEEVWARCLEKLARGEGNEQAPAGIEVKADGIVNLDGVDRESTGALGAEVDDDEDHCRILQCPEPRDLENAAGALDVVERNVGLV